MVDAGREPSPVFEGLHLRTDAREPVLAALDVLAAERELEPLPAPATLDLRPDPLGWRVVVSNARRGWVSVYPDVLVEPARVLPALTTALDCPGLLVGGQNGAFWAFELAVSGESRAFFRSDQPGDAALRTSLALALSPLLRPPASVNDLNALLAGTGVRETDAYQRLCRQLGLVNVVAGFPAIAEAAHRGGFDAEGHVLRCYGRPGLEAPAPPDDPLPPLL